jgi:IS5 family transposase
VSCIFTNKTEKGGHPNADEVMMIKLLAIQQWYGLSDEE